MDRRNFLKSTTGLAALASGTACVAAPDAAAPVAPRVLSFVSPWTAHHAGFADDAQRLARRIEAALTGTAALTITSASSARGEITIRPVQSELALHPAFAFFGGLPGDGALSGSELDAWLATGGGQQLWDDLAAPFGFKPLLAAHAGANPVLWSRAPIVKAEDLAGQRIVVRGLDAEVARALGAIPVVADERDLEGLIAAPDTDAVVWGTLVQSAAAAIPARFPHGLSGAFGAAGGTLAIEFDHAVWDELSPTQHVLIASAVRAELQAALADAEATRTAVAAALSHRSGATLRTPTPEFRAAVSRIAAALVAHTAAHDAVSARIDRSYTAFRRALTATDINVS